MKPSILILTDPFAAPGYLPRVRYMCDYLSANNYSIVVYTEKYQPLDFEHTYSIETIDVYSGSKIDWLIKTIWSVFTDWHNRYFANAILRKVQKQKFDYALCSSFSYFPLGAALRIADSLGCPLITDIRDLDEQIPNSQYQYHHRDWWLMPFRRLYSSIQRRRRNKVLRQADKIITISPWHKTFIEHLTTTPVSLIYNGFDQRQFYFEAVKSSSFTISYIGSLYEWQNPSVVYKAVEELGLKDIHIEFHTPQNNPVSHTALGDAIRQSGIMLVLTNPLAHGMMTTKFYEALGCEKPILCIPSDNGCLAEVIHETNAGLASSDIEEIKAFILDKYREWKQNGYTRQKVKNIEIFSRQYEAQQIEGLLCQQ